MNEALEQSTEELIQANRRLTLLTRIANDLILASASQDNLKEAFDAVALEIKATFYFNYQIDDKASNLSRSNGRAV